MLSTYSPAQARAAAEQERRRRRQQHEAEWQRCADDRAYFIRTYCQIYDATARTWIPFELWDAQERTLETLTRERLVIILKARQLGLTWLVLADALHTMLFHAAATITIFSRRDDEAKYLLGDERLKGMYGRLEPWMRDRQAATKDNEHEWHLTNGSVVTYAIVDEADLVPDLGKLMRSVKPTIDGGGRMVLLSRVDKSQPQSEFKAIYRGAKAGENGWAHVFLPWYVRPDRDAAWYEAQQRDVLSRTAALDDLHEQYPATEAEALAPRSLDKRIPGQWLQQCYREAEALPNEISLPGLVMYQRPIHGHLYVIGADPAEGNPTSDDSAATVLDAATGEEVAKLRGKFEPAVFASYVDQLGRWYLGASVLPERNNHGHAVLLWLRDNSELPVLDGHDGKPGWLSNSRGKALMYAEAADAFRTQTTVLRSFDTYTQLATRGRSSRRGRGSGAPVCGRRRRMQDTEDSVWQRSGVDSWQG
jgi:hypothetical protein